MRWSERDYADFVAKSQAKPAVSLTPQNRMLALGRLPTGKMNKTESAYADHLESLKQSGQVLWYKFEGIKLRLADNTFLTIDFPVLPSSSVMEMHEVKGFMQDDANVKLKVAASLYPFRFVLIRRKKGGWERADI